MVLGLMALRLNTPHTFSSSGCESLWFVAAVSSQKENKKSERLMHGFSDVFPVTQNKGISANYVCVLSLSERVRAECNTDMMRHLYEQK